MSDEHQATVLLPVGRIATGPVAWETRSAPRGEGLDALLVEGWEPLGCTLMPADGPVGLNGAGRVLEVWHLRRAVILIADGDDLMAVPAPRRTARVQLEAAQVSEPERPQ